MILAWVDGEPHESEHTLRSAAAAGATITFNTNAVTGDGAMFDTKQWRARCLQQSLRKEGKFPDNS